MWNICVSIFKASFPAAPHHSTAEFRVQKWNNGDLTMGFIQTKLDLESVCILWLWHLMLPPTLFAPLSDRLETGNEAAVTSYNHSVTRALQSVFCWPIHPPRTPPPLCGLWCCFIPTSPDFLLFPCHNYYGSPLLNFYFKYVRITLRSVLFVSGQPCL